MRHLTRLLALVAAGTCALLAPATASATSTKAEIEASVSSGVAYLKSVQLSNGGFESDWDLSALAAGGAAAVSVQKTGAATNARTWYQELVGNETATKWPSEAKVTEYERAALNAYAAGIDPARVSKTQDLIAGIASFYQPSSPGYYGEPEVLEGTVFGLLALADAKTEAGVQRVPKVLLEKSISVIEANQHTDGGWNYQKAEGSEKIRDSAAEPDTTGAAIAALCTAGVSPSTNEAVKKGVAYLKSLLVNASGAFESESGANTDANAWAVSGLNACGISPQEEGFTTKEKKTPIDFLISQQLSGGGFKYLTTGTSANEYSSQDAVRALAGAGFTATPPVPTGGLEQWFAESNFSTNKTVKSPLALIINNGTSALKVCSVSVAPGETTTTLGAVLDAAEASSSPTGCVTGVKSESNAITQINGYPSTAAADWEISIDGGGETQAGLATTIYLGDTIYLRLPTFSTPIEVDALGGAPTRLAFNSEGDVWVSEWAQNAVKEYSQEGKFLRQVSITSPCTGALNGPYGVALNSKGELWVADSLNNRVLKFNSEGKCLLQLSSAGAGHEPFGYPSGVTVGPNGKVWITDRSRVTKLNEDGEFEREFGSFGSGPGQFIGPQDVAVDSKGHVWVAEVFDNRVQELTETGEYLGQLEASYPSAVAVDPGGDVLVPEFGRERVAVFNQNRELLTAFGSEGSGEDQLDWPHGVAVDSKGNVWIADEGNKRIEKWGLSEGEA
jgi:sugar lactone lactonase YvrE